MTFSYGVSFYPLNVINYNFLASLLIRSFLQHFLCLLCSNFLCIIFVQLSYSLLCLRCVHCSGFCSTSIHRTKYKLQGLFMILMLIAQHGMYDKKRQIQVLGGKKHAELVCQQRFSLLILSSQHICTRARLVCVSRWRIRVNSKIFLNTVTFLFI